MFADRVRVISVYPLGTALRLSDWEVKFGAASAKTSQSSSAMVPVEGGFALPRRSSAEVRPARSVLTLVTPWLVIRTDWATRSSAKVLGVKVVATVNASLPSAIRAKTERWVTSVPRRASRTLTQPADPVVVPSLLLRSDATMTRSRSPFWMPGGIATATPWEPSDVTVTVPVDETTAGPAAKDVVLVLVLVVVAAVVLVVVAAVVLVVAAEVVVVPPGPQAAGMARVAATQLRLVLPYLPGSIVVPETFW